MEKSIDMNEFVGLPYSAADCWQLVKDVLVKVKGVAALDDDFAEGLFEKVDKPEPGDVLLFNRNGVPAHAGVYAGRDLFLHSMDGTGAVLSRLSRRPWAASLEGVYRL